MSADPNTGAVGDGSARPVSPQLELLARVQSYLGNGGFFNPEMMEHDKVRQLIIDLAKALAASPVSPNPDEASSFYSMEEWRQAALLKDRTRRAIRERHQAGENHASLAADFKVPPAFIVALCAWQMFSDAASPVSTPLVSSCRRCGHTEGAHAAPGQAGACIVFPCACQQFEAAVSSPQEEK